jgi:uncharacterized protein YycO
MDSIEAQPGDLLLFTRATGLNRLITWFTKSPFYHVAIFEGGTSVVEARPRGVVSRDLNGPGGDKNFVVAPAPASRAQALAALNWAKAQVGDGYDATNVIVLVLDRLFVCWRMGAIPNNRFSCGELVIKAFREAGTDLMPGEEAEDIVPADFTRFLKPGGLQEAEEISQTSEIIEKPLLKVLWPALLILLLIAGVWIWKNRDERL